MRPELRPTTGRLLGAALLTLTCACGGPAGETNSAAPAGKSDTQPGAAAACLENDPLIESSMFVGYPTDLGGLGLTCQPDAERRAAWDEAGLKVMGAAPLGFELARLERTRDRGDERLALVHFNPLRFDFGTEQYRGRLFDGDSAFLSRAGLRLDRDFALAPCLWDEVQRHQAEAKPDQPVKLRARIRFALKPAVFIEWGPALDTRHALRDLGARSFVKIHAGVIGGDKHARHISAALLAELSCDSPDTLCANLDAGDGCRGGLGASVSIECDARDSSPTGYFEFRSQVFTGDRMGPQAGISLGIEAQDDSEPAGIAAYGSLLQLRQLRLQYDDSAGTDIEYLRCPAPASRDE